MKTLLIALPEQLVSEEHLARVRALAPEHRVVVTRDRAEIEAQLDDIEITFGNFPRDLLAGATSLKWFQQWAAGADWLMNHPAAIEQDFVLTNASGVHAIPIAEHILAFMLAFARDLPTAFRNQQAAHWPRTESDSFELAGKTMLLVGVGRIGMHAARLAKGLDMRVTGVRRSTSQVPAGVDRLGELRELLPEADVVVMTVPLTAHTRNMIGADELKLMKESAILINIGRGGTVDEVALAEALRNRSIRGAGLDVFAHEPLAEDSELWKLDNLIITSHSSGDTPHYAERAFGIFFDNLERWHSGEKLRNIVDKHAGY